MDQAIPPARVGWRRLIRAEAALPACLLLAAALRLWHIGARDFWNNELFSLYWIRSGFFWLWGPGFHTETNPPLYYALLKLWSGVMGDGEIGLRLFSVILSVACVGVVGRLGRELAGHKAGVWAALLIAVAPMQIQIAQTARGYALLSLLAATLLLCLARLLREPPDHPRLPVAALYGVAAVAAIYTHATASFMLAALNLPVIGLMLRRRQYGALRALLIADAAVALLAVPALIWMIHQSGSDNLAYLKSMSPIGWLCQALILVIGLRLQLALATLAGIGLLLTGLALLRCRLPRDAVCLLVYAPGLYVLSLIGLDQARPMMQFHVLAWVAIPLCLLAGLLIAQGGRGLLALPLAAALCAGTILGLNHGFGVREDWHGLVRDVLSEPTDALVFGPQTTTLGVARYGLLPERPYQLQLPGFPIDTAQTALAARVTKPRPLTGQGLGDLIRAGLSVRLVIETMDEKQLIGLPIPRPPDRRHDFAGLSLLYWN